MWAAHHREQWADLDARELPTDAGRRLDVGGFVLADPFETVLRSLSERYLHDAWVRVAGVLARAQLTAPADLSWGWLHPGVTHSAGLAQRTAPSDSVGWTSRELKEFDRERYYRALDAELAQGQPALRCAVAWRSAKWAIPPDDSRLGLRLIEALATDELTDWAPAQVLAHADPAGFDTEAWVAIARALDALDQGALDQALAQARATYSPLGYRIVLRGYGAFIHQPGIHLPIRFPQASSR